MLIRGSRDNPGAEVPRRFVSILSPAAPKPYTQGSGRLELARAIAPDLPHHIVGIRPGEKLHEIMVPEDDSRSTVELDDRFVILPSHDTRRMSEYLTEGAKALPEGFAYSSDTNTERMDAGALRAILAKA